MTIWGPTAIASDADDAHYEELIASFNSRINEGYPSGEFLQVTRDGGSSDSKWGQLRFLNVTVPVGATINSATLEVEITAAGSIDAAQSIITVFADVGANRQDALSATHHSLSNWTNSTASSQLAGLSVARKSITVTSIIAELVALGGWASGDNICFNLDPEANGSDTYWGVDIADYDADTSATVATLEIEYTEAASGPTITDVNTTESWTDGATGLVITGTGFV